MIDLPVRVSNPPVRLLTAFQEAHPGQSPSFIVQAPGRDIWAAATVGSGGLFRLQAPDLRGRAVFSRRSAKSGRTVLRRPLPYWARYPAGVVADLCGGPLEVSGFQAVALGQEAQGPRYLFSLGLVVAALLHEISGEPYSGEELIEVVERVRRDYAYIQTT